MARRLGGLLFILLTLGLVGCDQVTKHTARSLLASGEPITLIEDVLELRHAENRNIAFSLTRSIDLPGKPLILGLMACLAMLGVSAWGWRHRHELPPLGRAAFAMILAGGIGNILDRLLRGSVTDFIHVHHWPIFNVADSLVLVGAVMLIFATRGVPALRT
jgi:signal peptidase II